MTAHNADDIERVARMLYGLAYPSTRATPWENRGVKSRSRYLTTAERVLDAAGCHYREGYLQGVHDAPMIARAADQGETHEQDDGLRKAVSRAIQTLIRLGDYHDTALIGQRVAEKLAAALDADLGEPT